MEVLSEQPEPSHEREENEPNPTPSFSEESKTESEPNLSLNTADQNAKNNEEIQTESTSRKISSFSLKKKAEDPEEKENKRDQKSKEELFKERYEKHLVLLSEKNKEKKEKAHSKSQRQKELQNKLKNKLGFASAASKYSNPDNLIPPPLPERKNLPPVRVNGPDYSKKKRTASVEQKYHLATPKTAEQLKTTPKDSVKETKASNRRFQHALTVQVKTRPEENSQGVGFIIKKQVSKPPKPEEEKHEIKTNFPFAIDYESWKKRNKLDPKTKVFVVSSLYPDIKEALLSRGWVENPDISSCFFDLKWALKSQMINHRLLEEYQIVNHFEKNVGITTKVGLLRSLHELKWFVNQDPNTFFPKCFDLKEENDKNEFIMECKLVKAESIIKIFLKKLQKNERRVKKLSEKELKKIKAALKALKNFYGDSDEFIDQKNEFQMISESDWKAMTHGDITKEELTQKKHRIMLEQIEKNAGETGEVKNEKKKKKNKKIVKFRENLVHGEVDSEEETQEESKEENQELLTENEKKLVGEMKEVDQMLRDKNPQYFINGHRNLWIVKPGDLSRGRSISILGSLLEIMDHTGTKENQWVAQKYIENPLLVKNKKFDIRQWVLVTSWNPLTIWIYDEYYIRFGVDDYQMKDLGNLYSHLTNNSIAKHSEKFQKSEFEGCMWDQESFRAHIDGIYGPDSEKLKVSQGIKNVVKWTLEAVQDSIENRKNSVELFGFDFMVDDQLNVWLLEINSSPAMDYSTKITERLVKEMSEDLIKVIVDYKSAKKNQRKATDTGKFKCVFKSKRKVEKPKESMALMLCVEGKAFKDEKKSNSRKGIPKITIE